LQLLPSSNPDSPIGRNIFLSRHYDCDIGFQDGRICTLGLNLRVHAIDFFRK
jgi:hypothetical protein